MNEIERKKRYRQHRLRVQNASSLVDSKAPKYREDHREPRELTFIEMMSALYNKRNQRTFTKSPVRGQHAASVYNIKSNELSVRNNFCSRLPPLQLEPETNQQESTSPRDLRKFSYTVPLHIWQRYNQLSFVRSPQILHQLLRPKIFLDLQTSKDQPLGRIVVQLFTEACPEIVLQFVRICIGGQSSRFVLTRLFTPLWLECELHLDDKSALTIPNIEHDPTAINHGSAAGILSFPSRYLRGSKFRFISFTISFKPIDVLNGKRIAFGKIRRGQHVLDNLQNFQVARNGKPLRDIVVASCGVL